MQVQPHSASSHVTGAIRQAANSTGASFDYLLATAQIESNLNPNAQAATSSARGLFQFIDQTWFATMKLAGPALGLDHLSDAIVQGQDGRFEVPDAGMRNNIMRLRSDPKISALMAGVFTRSNEAQLTADLGRQPSDGELYIAHFLGPDGASRLISAAQSSPNARAADVFPQAAGSNRPIFYDRSGHARTALEVYRVLTGRFESARAGATTAAGLRGTLPPDATPLPVRPPAPVPVAAPNPVPVRVVDTAGVTTAYADARADTPRSAAQPLFQSMFTSRGGAPVAPVVTSLWTPGQPAPPTPNAFNLFTDTRPAKPVRNGT